MGARAHASAAAAAERNSIGTTTGVNDPATPACFPSTSAVCGVFCCAAVRALADLEIVKAPIAIDGGGGCSGEKSGTGGNSAPPVARPLLPFFDCRFATGPEPPLLTSGDEASLLFTAARPGDRNRALRRAAALAAFSSLASRFPRARSTRSPIDKSTLP